jgi:hypothetical protein
LLVAVAVVMHTQGLERQAVVAVVAAIAAHGTTKLLGVVVAHKVQYQFRLVIIPLQLAAVVLEQQQTTQ